MSAPVEDESLRSRFRALRHANFRLFWSGQLVSLVGTWMQSVAQGWLMHRLTHSAFMLGLLGFAQFLPALLLSLWAGVVADRVERRRMLLVTQTCALIQAVILAALVTSGKVTPWMVLVLAFVFGIVNAFDLPARQSFLVDVVGREDLPNAIALNSAAFNVARVAGPALAGILVATIHEGGCFWLNAVSYVAVIANLARIRVASRASSPERTRIGEGIRYVLSVRPLRNLLLLLGCTAGLGYQYTILLPVYARDILHSGPETFGLLVSAFGIGSLLAAVVLTRRLDRRDLRRNLLVGLASGGVGMAAFAWSRALPLSLAAGLVAGFGLILYVASTNTMLQLTTEDRYRGRVMSLYTLMFVGTSPLGAIIAGTIAQHAGAPIATSFCALVLLAGALWVAYRLRVIAAREAQPQVEPAFNEKVG